jgi:hypothetical protein
MKVKELIAELSKHEGDADVWIPDGEGWFDEIGNVYADTFRDVTVVRIDYKY